MEWFENFIYYLFKNINYPKYHIVIFVLLTHYFQDLEFKGYKSHIVYVFIINLSSVEKVQMKVIILILCIE